MPYIEGAAADLNLVTVIKGKYAKWQKAEETPKNEVRMEMEAAIFHQIYSTKIADIERIVTAESFKSATFLTRILPVTKFKIDTSLWNRMISIVPPTHSKMRRTVYRPKMQICCGICVVAAMLSVSGYFLTKLNDTDLTHLGWQLFWPGLCVAIFAAIFAIFFRLREQPSEQMVKSLSDFENSPVIFTKPKS